jgi:hypothetical protein
MRRLLLVAYLVLLGASQARAQGLDKLKQEFPAFELGEDGQSSVWYVFLPTQDIMVKLEVSAEPGVFSNTEFGYLAGGLAEDVPEMVVEALWSEDLDDNGKTLAAKVIEDEAKTMRVPFQDVDMGFAFDMDSLGLDWRFTREPGTPAVTQRMTWEEVLEAADQ